MSDEYYSGKNEFAEVIEKRNRKYNRLMQKGSGNCCKLNKKLYYESKINLIST